MNLEAFIANNVCIFRIEMTSRERRKKEPHINKMIAKRLPCIVRRGEHFLVMKLKIENQNWCIQKYLEQIYYPGYTLKTLKCRSLASDKNETLGEGGRTYKMVQDHKWNSEENYKVSGSHDEESRQIRAIVMNLARKINGKRAPEQRKIFWIANLRV